MIQRKAFIVSLSCSLSLGPTWSTPAIAQTPPYDPNALGASAARPGDEAMTCDQIIAEMRTLQVSGVSAATASEAQAAGTAMQAEIDRQRAAAAAEMAAQTAATAAASAATAGGVQAADQALLNAQIAAQARAMANTERMRPVRERTEAANAAATGELMASIQANPRFGRLISLAGAKGCSGDF